VFVGRRAKMAGGVSGFNLTPIIDIVFLLMIFFMVVAHFIEAENFPAAVPDNCDNAESAVEQQQITTVTVTRPSEASKSVFAVGSEIIQFDGYGQAAERIAELLDECFINKQRQNRVVTLRIDRDVTFMEAQYALAGIAESKATRIKLAVFRNRRFD